MSLEHRLESQISTSIKHITVLTLQSIFTSSHILITRLIGFLQMSHHQQACTQIESCLCCCQWPRQLMDSSGCPEYLCPPGVLACPEISLLPLGEDDSVLLDVSVGQCQRLQRITRSFSFKAGVCWILVCPQYACWCWARKLPVCYRYLMTQAMTLEGL